MKKQTSYILNIILGTIIGLFNTVFIRPEHVGGWRNYVGYIFLFLAVLNIYLLINFIRNKNSNKGNEATKE